MKSIKLYMTLSLVMIIFVLCSQENTNTLAMKSIYEIGLKSLSGEEIDLHEFQGKKILFVNVASECGFTPQYADLEELYETYKDKLVIIGLPCNQFGGQEPGDAEDIQNFCSKNYGVQFIITEKIDVKGQDQHPLYQWLTEKDLNGVESSSVKWNFQKYLVDENGKYIDVFYSITNPMNDKITSYFQ